MDGLKKQLEEKSKVLVNIIDTLWRYEIVSRRTWTTSAARWTACGTSCATLSLPRWYICEKDPVSMR